VDTETVTVATKLRSFRTEPRVDTIGAGQTLAYSVTLTSGDGLTHRATIAWSSTGGAISSDGVFSPRMFMGPALVVAVCGCSAADIAFVAIRSSSPPASPILMSFMVGMRPIEVVFLVFAIWEILLAKQSKRKDRVLLEWILRRLL